MLLEIMKNLFLYETIVYNHAKNHELTECENIISFYTFLLSFKALEETMHLEKKKKNIR